MIKYTLEEEMERSEKSQQLEENGI